MSRGDYTVCAFFTAAANTPANFVLFSSGKKTDFTDRKAYLPLMSGKMANFTDRMIYLSLSSGKMTGFTDRMGLLPLLFGETTNFTDGEGIWSMLSGKKPFSRIDAKQPGFYGSRVKPCV